MLQKVHYDVVFNPSERSRAGSGMLMVRASQGKRSVDFPTNIYCDRRQFSDGYVNDSHPQHEGLNAMLNQIVLDIQNTEIEAFRRGIDVSVQAVFTLYTEKITAQTPLVDFCDHVMKSSLHRRRSTKLRFYDTVKQVDAFHKGVCLEDIDISFLKKFEKHLLARGVQESTVWGRMKNLRVLFNEAIRRELLRPNQNPFRLYELPEIRSRNDVIMFSEIEELELMGLKLAQDRHIRDLFCFACYSGLRFGDLTRLRSDNIRVSAGVTWLEVATQKTGTFVQIPISKIFFGNAMRVLEKYRSIEELVGYDNNASVNRGVKQLMERTGIGGRQHVTMHTARRSFITALTDFGVPIETAQKLAGHSKITTTTKYLQLSTATTLRHIENAFCEGNTSKILHVDIDRPVLRVSVTGHRLVIGGEVLRCRNCSFFKRYKCNLFKKRRSADDWCDSFSERIEGEPTGNHKGRRMETVGEAVGEAGRRRRRRGGKAEDPDVKKR